jgi:His/Glu/Gln/Arg/opine family amino acid ABC transporter permease subunit
MTFDIAVILQFWPLILKGFGVTIALFVLSVVLSLILGVGVAFARQSRFAMLAWIAISYIELVRNIPFMIQLFLIFFVLPFYGLHMPAFVVGVIVLTFYGSAYFGEIIRGAILSVPKGQLESARAVGMSNMQAMRRVIFPQMLGYFIPPATNQAIMQVKESAITSAITVTEMTMAAQIIQGETYSPIEVFLIISVFYWLLCTGIVRSAAWLEDRLQPYARRRPGKAGVSVPGTVRLGTER